MTTSTTFRAGEVAEVSRKGEGLVETNFGCGCWACSGRRLCL